MINSLIVVGGGTSGLVSSLMLKSSWPDLNITVIESSNIGIIGVGEGSTEHFKMFANHVGIYIPDLFRETDATFKTGIRFTNWHGDGTDYWHSISEQYSSRAPENDSYYMFLRMVSDNFDPADTMWEISRNSHHCEPLHLTTSQFHFDTFKLNNYLHKLAKEKGIEFIDADIVDVELDEDGYVAFLIDQNNQRYTSDFYVDSSGFRRVIGSKLGIKWISCQEELPMNSAMAFPTPGTHDIPSHTQATALSSGWMWRIPTQKRYGNGYVFCDSFITEDQAMHELETIHGEVNIGKKIKFTPGYVDNFFVKNCVMIGLSSIFVEPLEASSIGTTIQQTSLLIPAIFSYSKTDGNKTANVYNTYMEGISKNVIDFIQLHYFTQRDDSEFWRWCKSNIKLTEFNRDTLDYFKTNWVNSHYFSNTMVLFSGVNWIQVMHGLRLFDIDKIKSRFDKYLSKYKSITDHQLLLIEEDNKQLQTFSHRQATEILKTRYKEVSYEF